jgi:hypothetical protein
LRNADLLRTVEMQGWLRSGPQLRARKRSMRNGGVMQGIKVIEEVALASDKM